MALGYDGSLYILAFDHRGSFQKKMFGIEGDPTPEETETIADAKKLIFEGMEIAVESGVDEFDFQYGEQFGEHILGPDPDFSKVLVRLNPDGDAVLNERQLGRLR